jgi:hypothetical protein
MEKICPNTHGIRMKIKTSETKLEEKKSVKLLGRQKKSRSKKSR